METDFQLENVHPIFLPLKWTTEMRKILCASAILPRYCPGSWRPLGPQSFQNYILLEWSDAAAKQKQGAKFVFLLKM